MEMVTESFMGLAKRIGQLPPNWHQAGTMSRRVLEAIARYADAVGGFEHSAETGSGTTTLLLSHASKKHICFALDLGDSITRVKESHFFNPQSVTYVEGPSQLTLPRYTFTDKFDFVLIDGPHAYPFPELEYYYFYPQLKEGAVLAVDDVNIPSLARMAEIIAADDMFELDQRVEQTCFFRRTSAHMHSPVEDGWWLQGFNREYLENSRAREHAGKSFLRSCGQALPSCIKRRIPTRLHTAILKKL